MGERTTSNGLRALGIVVPLMVALPNPLASLVDNPDLGPVRELQSEPAAWAAVPQVVLRLGSLSALDATGRPLEARWSIGDATLLVQVDDTGAIYPLELTAVISGLPATADWELTWGAAGTDFHSVATAGDVNADGYSDVIIGAPSFDGGQANEGKAFIFLGHPLGLPFSEAWSKEPDQSDAQFGTSVGTAGDVNGDGYADVLIGAPSMTGDGGPSDEGLVRLYLGSRTGLRSSYAWTGEGNQTLAWYGVSVAGAGDVNGDGYGDLVIGAHQYNEVRVNEGKVFVYYGNGRSGVPLVLRQLNHARQPVALLGRTDSDTFYVNLTVSTPFGRSKFREEIEVKSLGARFNGQGTLLYPEIWAFPVLPAAVRVGAGDLQFGVPYHWRIRTLYNPVTTPWMPASRWVTVPSNGWNEQDLRTPGSSIYLPLVFRSY